MKGAVVLFAAIVQLTILIVVSAQYGLRAGVLALLGMIANGLQGAAISSPDAEENKAENGSETDSENKEE
jgi:hypothetical protein